MWWQSAKDQAVITLDSKTVQIEIKIDRLSHCSSYKRSTNHKLIIRRTTITIANSRLFQEREILESAPPSLTTITQIPAPQNRVIPTRPKRLGHRWSLSLRHWLQCSRLFPTGALITMATWCNLKISNQWDSNWTCSTIRTNISKTVRMTVLTFMAIAKTNNRQELLAPEAVPTHWSPMNLMKVHRCFHRVFQNHHKFYCKELKEISTLMRTNKISTIFIQHLSIRI